MIAVVIT
jgi:adenosylhomocysteinase